MLSCVYRLSVVSTNHQFWRTRLFTEARRQAQHSSKAFTSNCHRTQTTGPKPRQTPLKLFWRDATSFSLGRMLAAQTVRCLGERRLFENCLQMHYSYQHRLSWMDRFYGCEETVSLAVVRVGKSMHQTRSQEVYFLVNNMLCNIEERVKAWQTRKAESERRPHTTFAFLTFDYRKIQNYKLGILSKNKRLRE